MDTHNGVDTRFALIFSCNFVIGTPYSMPIAFLPMVAVGLGLDESEIGEILSVYAFGVFFVAAWAGQNMQKYDKKQLLNFALLLLISGLVLFSIDVTLKDKWTFQVLGLIARLIQGISFGLASCILFSLIPKFYKKTLQKKLALMELGSGLAVGLGPLVGSVFYAIAGFSASFLSLAVILLTFLVAMRKHDIFEGRGERNGDQEEVLLNEGKINEQGNRESAGRDGVSYKSLIKSRRMVITYIVLTVATTTVSVFSPVFSIFALEKYGISPQGTSLLLCISPFFYSIPAFFTDQVVSPKYDRRIYMMIGLICQSISVILVAGSFFVGQNIVILAIGLCFHGSGTFLAVIPGMPEIIDVIKEVHPTENEEGIHDFASGIFNGMWGLGELLGPLIGGYLAKEYKFKKAMEIYASIIWITLIAFIFIGRGYEAIQHARSIWNTQDKRSEVEMGTKH